MLGELTQTLAKWAANRQNLIFTGSDPPIVSGAESRDQRTVVWLVRLYGRNEEVMGIRLTCFQRRALDVVLGGVRVRQLVDDAHAVPVGVVDLHEGLPLVRESVLRKDRLDRALRLAGATVDALLHSLC